MNPIGSATARILAVDDQPLNLRLLEKMLNAAGYCGVVLVDDPRQVLSQYQKQKPDLILLDLNMPYLDGHQVMEQLKTLGDPLPAPIIVLTAQDERPQRLKALEAGARDFLSKPFDREELLVRVRNILDAHIGSRLIYDQKATLERLVLEQTADLRRAHAALSEREHLLREGARLGRFGAWVFDVEADRYQMCSDDLAGLFGRSVAEFEGDPSCQPRIARSDGSELGGDARVNICSCDGPADEIEFSARLSSGETRYFREISHPRRDEGTGKTYRIGVTQDVTDAKKLEEKLRLASDEYRRLAQLSEEANRSKSEFLANMSHELRTPLNAIIGFSELIMGSPNEIDREKLLNYINLINQSGQRLLYVIERILAVSQISAGSVDVCIEECDILAFLEECVPSLEEKIGERGLSMHFGPFSEKIWTDRVIMKKIFSELLSNSVKFNRSAGRVMIRSDIVDDRVIVSIQDTGIGMSDVEVTRAFERFTQMEASSHRTREGVGLGLFLVRQFVDLLGGTLSIVSEKGKGTSVRLDLPRRPMSALDKRRQEKVESPESSHLAAAHG